MSYVNSQYITVKCQFCGTDIERSKNLGNKKFTCFDCKMKRLKQLDQRPERKEARRKAERARRDRERLENMKGRKVVWNHTVRKLSVRSKGRIEYVVPAPNTETKVAWVLFEENKVPRPVLLEHLQFINY